MMIGVWLIFIKKVLSIVPMNVVLGFMRDRGQVSVPIAFEVIFLSFPAGQ